MVTVAHWKSRNKFVLYIFKENLFLCFDIESLNRIIFCLNIVVQKHLKDSTTIFKVFLCLCL